MEVLKVMVILSSLVSHPPSPEMMGKVIVEHATSTVGSPRRHLAD